MTTYNCRAEAMWCRASQPGSARPTIRRCQRLSLRRTDLYRRSCRLQQGPATRQLDAALKGAGLGGGVQLAAGVDSFVQTPR